MKTHRNILLSCFGGFSNTGITSGLACLEAVKELGLKEVAFGCLAGIPLGLDTVLLKVRTAEKAITVDGCPMECSKKLVEQAGLEITKSIILVRDIGMRKKSLSEGSGEDLKGIVEYVSPDDVRGAKELIVKCVREG